MKLSPEQYGTAFNAAPRPVRSYVVDGKLNEAVLNIAKRRNLHVDATGILQENTENMLLGVTAPAQVLGELILAGVDAETGKGILDDLNKDIFMPVREKVRHFTETGEDLISPKDPEEEAPEVPTPTPLPEPEKPIPPTVVPEVTVPPIQIPAPVAPPPVVVAPPAPPPMPVTPPAPPIQAPITVDEHPSMRTMATDMQAVKEHRTPEPIFSQPVPPISYTPPAAPPVRIAPPPAPPPAPAAMPQKSVTPPPNLPGAPVVHEYSVDPYRESV